MSQALQFSGTTEYGQKVANIAALAQALYNEAREVSGQFASINADDATGVEIATLLGNSISAADANSVKDIVGSIATDMSAGNWLAVLQRLIAV